MKNDLRKQIWDLLKEYAETNNPAVVDSFLSLFSETLEKVVGEFESKRREGEGSNNWLDWLVRNGLRKEQRARLKKMLEE